MTRNPGIRRAQVLAGVIAGLIVGTAHALVTHVVSRAAEPTTATVRVPARPALLDDDRHH